MVSPCVKIMSMLYEPVYHNLSPVNPGIVIKPRSLHSFRELYCRHSVWWVDHIICLSPDGPLTLEQDISGLINPHYPCPCSMAQSLCFQENWSLVELAQMFSGFHMATQLFSPNSLSSLWILHVEMLLLSPLDRSVRCAVDFWLCDYTKCLGDLANGHLGLHFPPHFFCKDNAWTLSFQVLIMHWTVFLKQF